MKHLKKRENTELKWKVNETHCGLRFAMTCLNNKGLAGWWLHFYLLNCYNILTSPAGKLWRVEVIIALFSFAAFLFLCTFYILFSQEMSAKCNNLCGSWKGRFFFISGLLCNIFMYCYNKTRHFFSEKPAFQMQHCLHLLQLKKSNVSLTLETLWYLRLFLVLLSTCGNTRKHEM